MKIVTQAFYYNLPCGCCTEWGTRLWIDGKLIDEVFTDTSRAYNYVLTLLGHELDELDDDYDC